MNIRIFLSLFLILSSLHMNAEEKILKFLSDIHVHKDASLTVTETISVVAERTRIKRGIVREFPTIFIDRWGNSFNVDFAVTHVTRDGHTEPYHVEDAINGKRIFIGSADMLLPAGQHVYTITYHTKRWLGFFDGRDELYWNVNGNGWDFAIQEIIARITLPEKVPLSQVQTEAYTGALGARGKNYRVEIVPPHRIIFFFQREFYINH